MAEDIFFRENTSIREVSSTTFYAKEKEFLSRMFEVFDFYKQNPPTSLRALGALRTMQQFLESDVARWSMGDKLRFLTTEHKGYALRTYHGYLMSDWEDAPLQFKNLFYFLTQSTREGPHRKAQEAFNFLRMDFTTRVNSILGDV